MSENIVNSIVVSIYNYGFAPGAKIVNKVYKYT